MPRVSAPTFSESREPAVEHGGSEPWLRFAAYPVQARFFWMEYCTAHRIYAGSPPSANRFPWRIHSPDIDKISISPRPVLKCRFPSGSQGFVAANFRFFFAKSRDGSAEFRRFSIQAIEGKRLIVEIPAV